ncbi:type VI secretion system tip protein VgrG [Candidatus Methylospira mobilis]|uniref:Type VI secretion system tip protein VgrG n=1 Tax=Candidatus Methylospira mobilis TaxID=1808979 RepID=A0A5Q0BCV0_9GAMM|nr:type VI secretion system tip protein TssI/VgrG [Candidatus Methylospira mobilis]QFY41695.1 type VI secretion system tip protein VgrG [Candidatus Methylospira mobilis]
MVENDDSLFSNRRYAFSVDGLSPQSFEVVRFDGEEAMSTLYRFDLLLASTDSDIDEGALITQTAQFSLNDGVEGGHPTVYRGLVQSFIYQYQISGWTFYRATLTPKLWLLDTFYLSEIYLEKTRPEIFLTILNNAGFSFDDFDVRFVETPDHPQREFVCQYQESYLTFIARWLERVGIYWWFEDMEGKEKVVFSNTLMGHKEEALLLHYQPPGELDALIGRQRRIQSLELEARNLPKTIVIRDYNEQRAGMEIMGATTVDPNGSGEVHIFGEHLQNNDEAAKFVALRAEGFRCRKHIYRGSSTATGLRCGEFMAVQGHPRSRFNQRYLVTGVRHRGSQSGLLLEGLSVPVEIDANRSGDFYLAEITAIPANVQFRPEITHPWPKIEGTMTGFIDAEGSGKYAELNENGEYKVQLPYDITEKSAKKASAWIRMASPYAGVDDGGSGHGMHFPLHKGAEVLLSFRNGNPDKPVIIGAVTNSITPNMVTNENQTQSVIHTAGGNSLEFHDEEGQQGIHFYSPTADTHFQIGAYESTPKSAGAAASDGFDDTGSSGTDGGNPSVNAGEAGVSLKTTGTLSVNIGGKSNTSNQSDCVTETTGNSEAVTFGNSSTITWGSSNSVTGGATNSVCLATNTAASIGITTGLNLGGSLSIALGGSLNIATPWVYQIGPDAVTLFDKKTDVATETITTEAPVIANNATTSITNMTPQLSSFATDIINIAETSISTEAPAINITGKLGIEGDTTITGAVQVTGDTEMAGALEVNGATTLNGDLMVDGVSTFSGVASFFA